MSSKQKFPLKVSLISLGCLIIVIFVALIFVFTSKVSKSNAFLQDHLTDCSDDALKNSKFERYKSAAVSTDAEPCAEIAVNILKKNGTAADAAISALFCIGIFNAQSSGLGGGFVATYYSKKEEKVYTLNAREVAPKAAYPEMFEKSNIASKSDKKKWFEEEQLNTVKGGSVVGVPGEVDGLYELYIKFGGMVEWDELIAPSIKLCTEGYKLTWYTAGLLNRMKDQILQEKSMWIFKNETTGELLKIGDTVFRPKLAETLRILQRDPYALKKAPLANLLVEDVKNYGGILTIDDLKDYKAVWKEPVIFNLENNLTLYSFPPPGSGLIVGSILKILERFGLNEKDSKKRHNADVYHKLAEAYKFSYSLRSRMGDIDDSEIKKLHSEITSSKYLDEIAAKFDLGSTENDASFYGASIVPDADDGTAHLSIIAANGDAAAVTTSINFAFGAGFRSESTGIILNNHMADFTKKSKVGLMKMDNNFIHPGRRPLSSMSPTIILDSNKDAVLVIGAAGGVQIPSAIASVAARNVFLGKNLKEAIDTCRNHHPLLPMLFYYEKGFPKMVLESMEKRGHKIEELVWKSVVIAVGKERLSTNGSISRAENAEVTEEINKGDGEISKNEKNHEWNKMFGDELVANSDYRKSGAINGY